MIRAKATKLTHKKGDLSIPSYFFASRGNPISDGSHFCRSELISRFFDQTEEAEYVFGKRIQPFPSVSSVIYV